MESAAQSALGLAAFGCIALAAFAHLRSRVAHALDPFFQAPPGASPLLVLVTCAELAAAGASRSATWLTAGADELRLYAALHERGVLFHVRAWSDASVDWSRYAFACVRTAWDYSDSEAKAAAFKAWAFRLHALGVRVLNHPAVIAWNSHKAYLAEVVARAARASHHEEGSWECAGIPTELARAGEPFSLAEAARRRGWEEFFLKPAVAGGSRGAVRVLRGGGLPRSPPRPRARGAPAAAAPAAPASGAAAPLPLAAGQAYLNEQLLGGGGAPGADMLVQPFLPTVARGEVSVVWMDGRITHAVRKRPAAGDFRCQEEFHALATLHPVDPHLAALVERVLAAARASTGALPADALFIARVDFLELDDAARSTL